MRTYITQDRTKIILAMATVCGVAVSGVDLGVAFPTALVVSLAA